MYQSEKCRGKGVWKNLNRYFKEDNLQYNRRREGLYRKGCIESVCVKTRG